GVVGGGDLDRRLVVGRLDGAGVGLELQAGALGVEGQVDGVLVALAAFEGDLGLFGLALLHRLVVDLDLDVVAGLAAAARRDAAEEAGRGGQRGTRKAGQDLLHRASSSAADPPRPARLRSRARSGDVRSSVVISNREESK